jgi:hypothetical protein
MTQRLVFNHPPIRLWSFAFNCALFAAMNARISADISNSLQPLFLIQGHGKTPHHTGSRENAPSHRPRLRPFR